MPSPLRLPVETTLALVGAGLVAASACKRSAPPPEPIRALWWWHRPLRITPAEAAALKRLNITRLFVHAGQVSYSETTNRLQMRLPQQWVGSTNGIEVHAVFNASSSVLRRLETLSEEVLASTLAEAFVQASRHAARVGIQLAGAQCDFDYPTRLLPRYGRMLALLKTKIAPHTLSVALLPTWYTSRELDRVLDATDFSAPQFYEAVTPGTRDKFAPISDPAKLARGLAAAGKRGKPFYAGLPAYGHALVFDAAGRLRGAYRDASADRLASDSRFRCLSASIEPHSGERLIEFTGTSNRDFRVLYDLPTPNSLARCWKIFNEQRPANCIGVALFRMPEPGETSTLPLTSLESLLSGATPEPKLTLRVRTRPSAPWNTVEGTGESATDVFIEIQNVGIAAPALGPDAVVLDVFYEPGRLMDAERGGFASTQPFAGTPENRSSLTRSNGVRLTAARLLPGERLVAGPLRLRGSASVKLKIAWQMVNANGDGNYTGTEELSI